MSSAKRYDISGFGGGMVEAEEGAWYHSDDYDALAAENARLREATAEAIDLIDQVSRHPNNRIPVLDQARRTLVGALAGSKEGE